MKIIKSYILLVNLITLCIIFSFVFDSGCKDPYEEEPPEDTLLTPPDPPQLVYPTNDFVFMDSKAVPGQSFFIFIQLDWDSVEQAEVYELELTTDTFPPNIIHCQTSNWPFAISNDTMKLRDWYWRVRASSSKWKWFTEWSEQWSFEARWRPFAPRQVYPPNGGVLFVDSFPASVALHWNRSQDEEFYELIVYMDSVLIDHPFLSDTSYIPFISDTGLYSWQVRAGSQYWQYHSFWSSLWNFRVYHSKY